MDIVNDIESLRQQPDSVVADPNSSPNQLDRDAFLRIFLTQLESQDPLSPQDSSELGAQLAQFSQLEQSVNTTQALEGISDKLDELITVTRGGTGASGLDPVGLLGRRIEFPTDRLTLPEGGTLEGGIAAEVPSGTGALLIQVFDEETGQTGAFSLARERPEPREIPNPSDPSGDPILEPQQRPPLAGGRYEIGFSAGQATLQSPTASGIIEFSQLRQIDGEFVQDRDAAGNSLPFVFVPGRSYRFDVRALDLAGRAEPEELTTSRSAVAESVRIVDGGSRIVAGGSEIDPTTITRILDQIR